MSAFAVRGADMRENSVFSSEMAFLAQRPLFLHVEEWLVKKLQEWQNSEQITLSHKLINALILAADEIFTNIIVHGYANKISDSPKKSDILKEKEGDKKEQDRKIIIQLHFDSSKEVIELIFIDTGTPYNPLEAEEPKIHTSLKDRKVGGLGLFLVKKFMDTVQYSHKDGKNILTVKKRIV